MMQKFIKRNIFCQVKVHQNENKKSRFFKIINRDFLRYIKGIKFQNSWK